MDACLDYRGLLLLAGEAHECLDKLAPGEVRQCMGRDEGTGSRWRGSTGDEGEGVQKSCGGVHERKADTLTRSLMAWGYAQRAKRKTVNM